MNAGERPPDMPDKRQRRPRPTQATISKTMNLVSTYPCSNKSWKKETYIMCAGGCTRLSPRQDRGAVGGEGRLETREARGEAWPDDRIKTRGSAMLQPVPRLAPVPPVVAVPPPLAIPPVEAANLAYRNGLDRKSTRLNSSHSGESRMPSSA